MIDTLAQAAVQALLDRLVADGDEIGVQVVAYRGEEPIVDTWAGTADFATGRAVDGDTLFNAFSVAKAITATAVHVQAERGLIAYDAPLATYWPEFAGNGREHVTVRHVLTHRSGMAELPTDLSPDQICDWAGMVSLLERTKPAFPPGTASGYQSMSFGWLLGEIVRRTDPLHRDFGRFVHEEIGVPLDIADLWLGIPDAVEPRVATLEDSAVTAIPADHPYRLSTPMRVDLMADPYSRPEVRRACIPAVGAIVTARSVARHFAMLANGGAIDGTRLLSASRVARFSEPREGYAEVDRYFQRAVPVGQGGYYLGGAASGSSCPARNPRALCQPGMGGSFAMADPDSGLAMAFCHNRLSNFGAGEDDVRARIVRAIEATL